MVKIDQLKRFLICRRKDLAARAKAIFLGIIVLGKLIATRVHFRKTLGISGISLSRLLLLFLVLNATSWIRFLNIASLDDKVEELLVRRFHNAPDLSNSPLIIITSPTALDRKEYAHLIQTLATAGPKVIALDIQADDTVHPDDALLASSIAAARMKMVRVVLGARRFRSIMTDRLLKNLPEQQHTGIVMLRAKSSADNSFRWWRYELVSQTSPGYTFPSFALTAFLDSLPSVDYIYDELASTVTLTASDFTRSLVIDTVGRFIIIPPVSPDVFKTIEIPVSALRENASNKSYVAERFGLDKSIVVFGIRSDEDKLSPSDMDGPYYGYHYHATAMAALLTGTNLSKPSFLANGLVIALSMGGAFALKHSRFHNHRTPPIDTPLLSIPFTIPLPVLLGPIAIAFFGGIGTRLLNSVPDILYWLLAFWISYYLGSKTQDSEVIA